MALSTVYDVRSSGVSGLWGLLQGYNAELPLIISLGVVAVGIAVCIWGAFERKKQYSLELIKRIKIQNEKIPMSLLRIFYL